MKKMVNLFVDNASGELDVPSQKEFAQWVTLAAAQKNQQGSINLRLVDKTEIQALNKQFRQQDKPTNVLSFPFEPFEGIEVIEKIIGDIALCPEVIAEEAKEQHKELVAHWAHMSLHSVLHLLGYDHQNEVDAKTMEQLEINLLHQLGYENPYE